MPQNSSLQSGNRLWNQQRSQPSPSIYHLCRCCLFSAFAFDAVLCVRPLAPLQSTRGPQRSHYRTQKRRQKLLFYFQYLLDGDTCGCHYLWEEYAFPQGFLGQWLLFRTVRWPRWRNAPQSKATQADRTQVNNKNIFSFDARTANTAAGY